MEAADAAVRSAVVFFPLSLCLEHHRRAGLRDPHQAPEPGTPQDRRMEFKSLVEAAEKWCTGNPFDLIFAEEDDERRLDFYAEPGVSFYVLCPGGTDNFVREPPQGLQAQCVCMCVCVCRCVEVGSEVGLSRLFPVFFFSAPHPPISHILEDGRGRLDGMMSFHIGRTPIFVPSVCRWCVFFPLHPSIIIKCDISIRATAPPS